MTRPRRPPAEQGLPLVGNGPRGSAPIDPESLAGMEKWNQMMLPVPRTRSWTHSTISARATSMRGNQTKHRIIRAWRGGPSAPSRSLRCRFQWTPPLTVNRRLGMQGRTLLEKQDDSYCRPEHSRMPVSHDKMQARPHFLNLQPTAADTQIVAYKVQYRPQRLLPGRLSSTQI